MTSPTGRVRIEDSRTPAADQAPPVVFVRVRGAREHKNVDVDIPRASLTVSSQGFGTLCGEAQRLCQELVAL